MNSIEVPFLKLNCQTLDKGTEDSEGTDVGDIVVLANVCNPNMVSQVDALNKKKIIACY